jgi:hypothetical protein
MWETATLSSDILYGYYFKEVHAHSLKKVDTRYTIYKSLYSPHPFPKDAGLAPIGCILRIKREQKVL